MTARSGWWRVAAAIALIGTGAVAGAVVSAKRSQPKVVVESLQDIVLTRSVALNTDVTVSLETGQSAQLNFGPNPYSLEKYILYFYAQQDGQKFVRGDAYFTDGHRTGGDCRIDLDGALRQLGYTPCLAIVKWNVREGQARIDLRVSDDLEYNFDEDRRCRLADKKMSIQYMDRRLLFPEVVLPETERLTGFIHLWSEAKFNFAFWDRVPQVDWDAVLVEYIPKIQEAKTDIEYYRVLRRCIALLQDGHTGVWGPSDEPHCKPPIEIAAVQGKAIVLQVHRPEQIEPPELKAELIEAGLQPGDEITQIDGRTVEQILTEDLYPYIAASTPQQRELVAYPQLARGEAQTKAKLRVRDLEGREREICLTRGRYSFPREDRPFLSELPGGILRINLDTFDSDEVVKQFDEAFGRVLAAKGLILDLRNNGGGSSGVGYGILKKLIDKPVEGSHWKTRQYLPAFRAWGRPEQWYEGTHGTIEPAEGERYCGPVAVLTGPGTASAAEDFVVAFQTSGRGKVVGRRTLGSTGQPLTIQLPGGGGARICTKRDTYPDGREFVGIGCIPDVEVIPTRADVAVGRDAVLEKAVALLREQAN